MMASMVSSASFSKRFVFSASFAIASLIIVNQTALGREKIPEQILPGGRQNGLRMKLHALDAQLLMAQAHDFPVLGGGSDFQAVGEGRALDRQRVIARSPEAIGNPGKHFPAIMFDQACLAMNGPACPNGFPPEHLTDALMAKTDAKNRNPAMKFLYKGQGNARLRRSTRAGRQDNRFRRHRLPQLALFYISFVARVECARDLGIGQTGNHIQAIEQVQRLEQLFRVGLDPLRALPHVGDVRVIGGVGAVELKGEGGYLDQIGPRLGTAFLERGLLLRPLGNVVYFMPPYAITSAEVEWSLGIIERVLSETCA